jgi:hypothetical protein
LKTYSPNDPGRAAERLTNDGDALIVDLRHQVEVLDAAVADLDEGQRLFPAGVGPEPMQLPDAVGIQRAKEQGAVAERQRGTGVCPKQALLATERGHAVDAIDRIGLTVEIDLRPVARPVGRS